MKDACGIGTGCATCATTVNAKIFAGATMDTTTSIGIDGIQSDTDGGLLEQRFELPANGSRGPAVVVCRDGVGQGEADILIDSIIGECQ